MLEAKVENYFCEQVKALGGSTRKLSYIGRRGATDQLVLLEGFHCVVEMKRPGEVPRRSQNREHDALRRAGFAVWVLDSIEAVDEWVLETQEIMK